MKPNHSDHRTQECGGTAIAHLPSVSHAEKVMEIATANFEDLACFYGEDALEAFRRTAEISRHSLLRALEVAGSLHEILSAALGIKVEPYVTGSHLTGMFAGPKDSRNLAHVRKVHEVDIFVPLPSSIDPHDDGLITCVAELANVKGPRRLTSELSTPGLPVRQTLLYGYPDLVSHDRTGIPLEVEINLLPLQAIRGADPSLYWSQLFSPEERYWMRECRRMGREHTGIPYDAPGGVKALKEHQQRVARGRLIAGYANGYLLDAVPDYLVPFLWNWREYLDPPMPRFSFPLAEPPELPRWIRCLREL